MATTGDPSSRSKKRGIRASRVKLERALADSDLERKTQAALASRIADLEELDAAPKDLVSKAFRELPVDAQTLERIARGLGVPAEDLYMERTAPDAPPVPANPMQPEDNRGATRSRLPLIGGLASLLALLAVVVMTANNRDWPCHVQEAFNATPFSEDKLGILIARFQNDPTNRAQQYLAANLLADRNLAPYLAVAQTCRRPGLDGPGDLHSQLRDIRRSARDTLAENGGHLLLWGRLQGDRVLVRFVSTREDISPIGVNVAGRPLRIEEDNLELSIPIGQPSEALADMKKLALELMQVADPGLLRQRSEAVAAYRGSVDWLRASIISQRNLRRMLDARLDPRHWALVNAKLCYEQRLLGDYESNPQHYEDALAACRETLNARPREKFPRDWAASQINQASSLIRLHYYAGDRTAAIRRLREAEAALLKAAEVIDRQLTPQLWIVQQRNLGTTYLRLGELTQAGESADHFARGIALLKTALSGQDPAFQPLDWAITQQNICLALYQHGMRLGGDGMAMVQEARSRCAEALDYLSPENTTLSWAMVQNNLAASTAILAQMEGNATRLRQAIGSFRAAQAVYRRDRLPEKWAETELNLGELQCNLALLEGEAAPLDQAARHLDAALEVFIEKGHRRYQEYAEGLLRAVKTCDPENIGACACGHAANG